MRSPVLDLLRPHLPVSHGVVSERRVVSSGETGVQHRHDAHDAHDAVNSPHADHGHAADHNVVSGHGALALQNRLSSADMRQRQVCLPLSQLPMRLQVQASWRVCLHEGVQAGMRLRWGNVQQPVCGAVCWCEDVGKWRVQEHVLRRDHEQVDPT